MYHSMELHEETGSDSLMEDLFGMKSYQYPKEL